jgi:hypothetical protein
VTHDSDYSRKAAEARAAASHKGASEEVRIAGDLALAYAALAKRRAAKAAEIAAEPEIIALQE